MTKMVTIDAKGMHYTPLNRQIREAVGNGAREIVVNGVLGQRFIGSGLRGTRPSTSTVSRAATLLCS